MSTDDINTAPATLAAAPVTAHCAYDFSQVDVFAENPLEGNADRKSTRLNSSHPSKSRMPSSA